MQNATPSADTGTGRKGAAARSTATRAGAILGLICLAAATGCSSSTPPAASTTPAASATASATAASQPTVSASTATVPASASPSATAAGAVPTLGQLAGVFVRGQGFGQVKPSRIFNGGDPTGLVTHVVWASWGGARAVATGTSEYVGPNQTDAEGTEEPATVMAFDLGTCDGKLMYQAIEWYFPQHGQAFNPNMYENICTGSYVGTP
jgi:hypothetical protein